MLRKLLPWVNSILKRHQKLVLGVAALCLAALLVLAPAPPDRILNVQNYLITVGGIISAFVISYLAAKVFEVRRERIVRKSEIDGLAEKLTLFRRLLFYVMKSHDFWVHYDHISAFKKKYPDLDYARLHTMHEDPAKDDPTQKEFFEYISKPEVKLSYNTIDLYLAMEAVVGRSDPSGSISWIYDRNASFNYSLPMLSTYYNPCGQIWYFLEGRFGKHGAGRFNDIGLWAGFESDARDCISRIEPKFRGQDFHREILASLATDFHEVHLPRLYTLISENIGIPKILLTAFRSLFIMMLFGVLFPIVLQSLKVTDNVNVTLTLFFVWVTSIALLTFILDFFQFVNDEVEVVKQK